MPVAVSPIPSPSSRRLGRFSRLLSLACLLGVVALPLIVSWQWAQEDPASLYASLVPKMGADPLPERLDPWQRLVGAGLTLIPVAFSMLALLRVRRCFDSFAAGRYFEAAVVDGLRGFAGMTALSCAVGFVLQAPLSALLSWHNAEGHRFISFGIGSEQVRTLFFAATVWIIAAVMARAVALARENAEFV